MRFMSKGIGISFHSAGGFVIIGSFIIFLFTASRCARDLYITKENHTVSPAFGFTSFINGKYFIPDGAPIIFGVASSKRLSTYPTAPCFFESFAMAPAIFLYIAVLLVGTGSTK